MYAPSVEEWRAVPGEVGRYCVSDRGRVYSFLRGGRLLRPGRMPAGHVSVALGRGHSRCVHELVLQAFEGPPPPGHEARHKNGVPNDNRWPDNLEWATRGRNTQDKKWHNGASTYKLTGEQASRLKQLILGGAPVKDLALHFGVSKSTVRAVRDGVFHRDA